MHLAEPTVTIFPSRGFAAAPAVQRERCKKETRDRGEAMLSTESILSDLVLDHPASAAVLQRHRIDFCCHGHRSLAEAARQQGLDPDELLREIRAAVERTGETGQPDPRHLSSVALVAHIVATYHEPLRDKLPFLLALAQKVARVHGERNERLTRVEEITRRLHDDLLAHLDREETKLFPAIMAGGPEAAIQAELSVMRTEHLETASLLEELHEATEGFSVPDWACASYRTLFSGLAGLDEDLRRHVHLENHVLMPRFAR